MDDKGLNEAQIDKKTNTTWNALIHWHTSMMLQIAKKVLEQRQTQVTSLKARIIVLEDEVDECKKSLEERKKAGTTLEATIQSLEKDLGLLRD